MTAAGPAVIVLAKAPLPGRAKTRLTPPCTPGQAAALAEAALLDTLDAAAVCGAARRVLAFDGDPRPWAPPGFEVIPQRGTGLDERLAAAFVDARGPALLVGMDTPQVTPSMLDAALQRLADGPEDALLGMAPDGGFWAIALHRPETSAFLGVPMSTTRTGEFQRTRLDRLGLTVGALPMLRDVDLMDDAIAVAAEAPWTRFAARLALTLTALEPAGAR